jgi:hypothetical protein
MFTLAFTVMPPSDPACVPIERTLTQSFAMAPMLLFGLVRNCTDKIYSGHTTVATLLWLFWREARIEQGDRPWSFWRVYPAAHLLAMTTSSVLGRHHFTVDIVVSFIITALTYWSYRMLLTMARSQAIHGQLHGAAYNDCLKYDDGRVTDDDYRRAMKLVWWCEGMDLVDDVLLVSAGGPAEDSIELGLII